MRVLQILVTCLFAGLLVWFVDWEAVLPALRRVQLGWAATMVLLVLVERMILNIKWQALLATGGIRIGFLRLFRVQLAANALGTFLPSSIGVDALRIAGLWRFRSRRHEAVAATLLDRMTTVLATVVVGGAMIVLVAGAIVGRTAVIQVVIGGVVLLGSGLFLISPPGRRLLHASAGWLPAGIRDRVRETGTAAMLIAGHRRAIVITVATSLGAVLLRIVIGKCLLLACDVDVSFLTLAYILPVVWAVAMLPISIGGIGVQDAAYVMLLGYAGVGSAVAIVVSLLDHVLARVPMLFGVLFWRDVVPTAGAPAESTDPTGGSEISCDPILQSASANRSPNCTPTAPLPDAKRSSGSFVV